VPVQRFEKPVTGNEDLFYVHLEQGNKVNGEC